MSKKGLVNKYLYGKDNKTDFTDAMLPARRREQFGYLFKNNYLRLFYLNLIVFIFFLQSKNFHTVFAHHQSVFIMRGGLSVERYCAPTVV